MQSLADAVNIAEDISILFLLHEVAVLPKSNPVTPPIFHRPKEYSLSFKKERDLTIMLAYISCIKDNPNRVPALCIRENKAANQLDILFAVNASSAADNGDIPKIQKEFQRLFNLLPSAPTSDNAEQAIFTAIVSMCTPRILERLRLVRPKDKRKEKPPMETHIVDSIRILAQESPAFADAAKDWVHKIHLWKKHQTTLELTKVVESAHHLSRLPDLESLLGRISNQEMAPDSRKSLLNAIRKVARYRIAARILYRAAKKFPVAREMNFVPVNLPEVAFQKVPATMQAPGRRISEALSRTTLSKRECKQMSLCYGCLKTDQEKANKRFRDQKIKTLGEAKVHAEVQLVFFCETKNFQPPPRVISSSKDACFLCNALIKVHGKYHIPRQHGRLYPGWRMPWFPVPNIIQSRFAKHLEEVISRSIRTMIQSQRRINHPPPNESTTLTVTMSETTAGANSDCHPISSRGSSPMLEVPQPVPPRDPGEVGASGVRLPKPGSPSPSIANVAKAQGEMASQTQDVVDQGEHGGTENSVPPKKPKAVADQGEHRETENPVLPEKPKEVADQGKHGEKEDSVLPEKPEEVTHQGEHGEKGGSVLPGKTEEVVHQGEHKEKGNSVLPGKPEEVVDQGGEKGELVLSRKPPEVGDEGEEEGKTVVPPGKPPKVPPRPPPKGPPRVFSERWAKLSSPAPNRLIQGTSQVVNVGANTSSRFYKGGFVGLEIEYSTTGPAEKRAARDLSCNLEWLATADAETVRADKDALVINVEKLEDEIPIPSKALGKWYIATNGMVIRVQIQ